MEYVLVAECSGREDVDRLYKWYHENKDSYALKIIQSDIPYLHAMLMVKVGLELTPIVAMSLVKRLRDKINKLYS